MMVLLSNLYTVLPGVLKLLHPGLPARQNASHSGFILHHFWENPSQPSEGNDQKSAQTWDNIHKNLLKAPKSDNDQQIGPKSVTNKISVDNNLQIWENMHSIEPRPEIGRIDELDQLGKPHLDNHKTSLLIDGQPSGSVLNYGEIEKTNPQNWEKKQSKEPIQNNNQKIGQPSGQVWDNKGTEKTIGDDNSQNLEKIRKLIKQNLNRQKSLLNNGQPSGHIWNKIQTDKNFWKTQSKELIWGNNQQIGGSDETDPLGKQGLDNIQPIQLGNGKSSGHEWDKNVVDNEWQNWKKGQPLFRWVDYDFQICSL
jgi:hypothetical protein